MHLHISTSFHQLQGPWLLGLVVENSGLKKGYLESQVLGKGFDRLSFLLHLWYSSHGWSDCLISDHQIAILMFENARLSPLVHQHIFILCQDGVNPGYPSRHKWSERCYCSLQPRKDFPILQRLFFAAPLLRWEWYPQHWSLISYLLLRAQIFHWDIGRRSEICIPSWIALKTVLVKDPVQSAACKTQLLPSLATKESPSSCSLKILRENPSNPWVTNKLAQT